MSNVTNQSKPVYIFDLDGVVTDLANSQVNEAVIQAMYRLLAEGSYVALNTGRSFEWVKQNLLEQLRSRDSDQIFDRFRAVCEKGGEVVAWQHGQWAVSPSEFSLPDNVYQTTKAIFNQHRENLKTMFWDDTKRTMASIEKLPSADLDTFHTEQRLLMAVLTNSLSSHEIRIEEAPISIDVESPLAGKRAGAHLIYEWLKSRVNVRLCSFISFGDSVSDYEMARYFAEQSAPSTFVYVGKSTDKLEQDERVIFMPTRSHYALGTLEFLSKDLEHSTILK